MRIPHAAIRGVAATAALVVGAIIGAPLGSAQARVKKAEKGKHHHRRHQHRKHRHRRHEHPKQHEHRKHRHRRHEHPKHRHRRHRHHPTQVTPPTAPPATAPVASAAAPRPAQPAGVPGSWSLVFDDEFNGTAINASVWNEHDGWTNQNNVTDHAANVTESGGAAALTLASSSSGATIGTNQGVLGVGDFAEARVDFAGSGTTIYSWPAWWASGPNWPAAGENDIAEGLAGTLTVNYHSPSGAHNQGTIPGDWGGAFHTYGIYRGAGYCAVYWDGQLVKRYSTDDNGQAQQLLFTIGAANTLEFGTAGRLQVDYVRVWAPG